MARPRKYRTKKELKEANRKKNKAFYERNKEAINKRRKERRMQLKAREARKQARREARASERLPTGDKGEQSQSLIQGIEAARKAGRLFRNIIGSNGTEYVSSVCASVLEELRQERDIRQIRAFVEGKVEQIASLRRPLVAQQDLILQEAGIEKEFHEIASILREVDTVHALLEDLAAHLFDDGADFGQAYARGDLFFQQG
ncbi:hypothetical protein CC1G_10787 [Coprinopsis cinerea okayama7|uniref:Uncharacterized protein n=1 Tax=Coprinopsis cinerea (strain Okayama-7 / 130 / ATCC MYA-4618 / FGSC 9003) TaxID=240176 RepID=A8NMH0_COPC7|nr:hypothetical protein CC1G_10787 [Coprinopsis cinerea okayama7\|eukprot:XP_001834913.1 hypothetical protein CC1G_10787 [Coprinopsis cinerea okayama7\